MKEIRNRRCKRVEVESEDEGANLAKRALADSAMEIEMKEIDLSVEVYWFREAAPHVAFPLEAGGSWILRGGEIQGRQIWTRENEPVVLKGNSREYAFISVWKSALLVLSPEDNKLGSTRKSFLETKRRRQKAANHGSFQYIYSQLHYSFTSPSLAF